MSVCAQVMSLGVAEGGLAVSVCGENKLHVWETETGLVRVSKCGVESCHIQNTQTKLPVVADLNIDDYHYIIIIIIILIFKGRMVITYLTLLSPFIIDWYLIILYLHEAKVELIFDNSFLPILSPPPPPRGV